MNYKLDLSAAQVWADTFKSNTQLVHLDLSYNSFERRELEVIGEALKENHTLMGLHIEGNEGRLDPQGFIKPLIFE